MSPLKTKSSVQAISKNVNLGSQTSSGDQVSTTTMSPKIARLSNLEVSELITRNKTSNEAELFPISHTQKEEGKKGFDNFILSSSQKSLSKLFASAKRLEAASEKIQRGNMSSNGWHVLTK